MNLFRTLFPALRFTEAALDAIDASGLTSWDVHKAIVAIRQGRRTPEEFLAEYLEKWPAHEQGWRDLVAMMTASA